MKGCSGTNAKDVCGQRSAAVDMSKTMDGHTGGLPCPVLTIFGPPGCIVRGHDPWNDDNDAEVSARHAGCVLCPDATTVTTGQADRPLELEGESLEGGRRMANLICAQTKCKPAKICQWKGPPLYNILGHFSGADPTSAKPPKRAGPCHCVCELCRGAANETLIVGRADVEGECQDVQGRPDMPVCQTIGVHKAWDACKILDAGEVLDEGMVCRNGEMTHLCPRSSMPEGYI